MIATHPYKKTIMPHFVAILIYLSHNYSYHIIRGDRSPLNYVIILLYGEHNKYTYIYNDIFLEKNNV